MTITCKKYDLQGKELAEGVEITLSDEPLANSQMIKDYIVALRANARQWSACTKGRSENRHSKKKPHAQKGTGNARQGFLGAPQYRGGGRYGGPRPKFDQHVRINRKERRAAIRSLLREKIEEGNLIVLQDHLMQDVLPTPKTQVMVKFMRSLGFAPNCRALYLGKEASSEPIYHFKLSLRNIPRSSFMLLDNVNGYDLLVNHKLIVNESAVADLKAMLGE